MRRSADVAPAVSMADRAASGSRRMCAGRLGALLACGLALVACGGGGGEEPGLRARHVVVISMDTTRADHMDFYGSRRPLTPRLDALARESLLFADFATVAPSTLAAHTSLFTGNYPHRHGVPRNGFMVNPENEMLPEILSRAGFRTVGFAASFALASRFDFAQGFEHYDEQFGVRLGQGGADQDQRPAAEVTEAVVRYLNEEGVPDHLFLFVHYFDPHQPYAAPEPWATKYDINGRSGLPRIPGEIRAADRRPVRMRALAGRFAKQYAAEISYMDHEIGRLLDALRGRGILDEALTLVTSDHGEGLWIGEDGFGHGLSLYQNTMRAVLLARLPAGQRGGTRVEGLAASVDVLPTLLRTLGLPVPPDLDGEAFDLWDPQSGPTEAAMRFAQATMPYEEVETDARWYNLRKARYVRQERYKLLQIPYLGREALYDLRSDPGETQDLLEDPTAEVAAVAYRLRGALGRWADSARPLASRFDQEHLEETVERLRRLGYVVSPPGSLGAGAPRGIRR